MVVVDTIYGSDLPGTSRFPTLGGGCHSDIFPPEADQANNNFQRRNHKSELHVEVFAPY